MSKIVVLGGSGGIGTVAVRALATVEDFAEIVVADLRAEDACSVAAALERPGARGMHVDIRSPESLADAIRGASVVLNCAGPFYELGPLVLAAAIREGVRYVDVCDDLAPTIKMLEMDESARAAGVSALIGMGNSPGLANVFVRLCADMLLDQVETVDIMHVHGGEPEEGPAVVKHRIFAMVNDIPLFLDGKFVNVRQLEESGRAFVKDVTFRNLGTYQVYPYPHPETVTLPRFVPGLRRATNLGVIFPLSYFHLTQDMARVGACTEKPLVVQGKEIVPLEFSVAHVLSERKRLLEQAGVTGPAGCLKVVVSGRKNGETHTFVFSLSSTSAGAGEGTGIPAAVGAILMQRGAIERKGVFPPEAGVRPIDVLSLSLTVARKLGSLGGDSVHVEHIDPQGKCSTVPLPF
ncbi:MAG: saccharopine dehydrogenase NADP-binding domain-containing protein [Deltaproteobacteria bacterium]|nr:saccharopine dehydrogenase NADP-binding domain-containing protein [Deltaproteobacteria bacterium]